MTPERWQQVRDVLARALEIDSSDRDVFLDQACARDSDLRKEVQILLASGDGAISSFLQSPAISADLASSLDEAISSAALREGQIFANVFLLVHKLGEGGMGQVWLAEQTSPVRRQVALKLIKSGMYDELVVQRFRSELQSLAIMEHPAIAKIFDAGTTAQGQPYFVMEYVPGLPITEYCDEKKLPIQDRLKLFAAACEGVQHAHQKAVIHRDLKPANILVMEVDGRPVPRVIDFGLAKATTPTEGQSLFTQVGHFVGTPGYMSPEQADPNTRGVDTRTDVYSLGAVLYVLLTGTRPFDGKSGEKVPLDEQLRRLRQDDPPSPSHRVNTSRVTSSATAEARGTSPKHLAGLLRGDLDWITIKALEKDPARRYGTPSELALDVQRYLNDEPVVARPASAGYRMRKYAVRHRVSVGVAASAIVLLAGFSILQSWQLRRVTRERDRANRITDFMTDMFKMPDPSKALGNKVTAREILDKASQNITTGLAKDPELQADLEFSMAGTYGGLGLYSQARNLAESALALRQHVLGSNARKTLESENQVAWLLDREDHYPEAENLIRQAIGTDQRVLGLDDPVTLDAMGRLSVILQDLGRFQDQEKLQRQVVDLCSRRLGPEDPRCIRAEALLASSISFQGRNAEAESVYRKVLASEQRVFGADAPETLFTMHALADTAKDQGRYSEAETLYRQTLAAQQRVLGPEHPETTETMVALAYDLYHGAGRYSEAESLDRRAYEIEQRVLGPENRITIHSEEGLANLLQGDGQYVEAERLQRDILATRQRELGPEHTDVLLSKYNLATVLRRSGQSAAAEKLLRETLDEQMRILGNENADALATKAYLADLLNDEGRYREAEKLAREAFEVQLRVLGPQDMDTVDSLQDLGVALVHNRRYDEAKRLYEAEIQKIGAADSASISATWNGFACVAAAANDREAALQYLRKAFDTGYEDVDRIRKDPDLKLLHGDPAFEGLLAAQEERAKQNAPNLPVAK